MSAAATAFAVHGRARCAPGASTSHHTANSVASSSTGQKIREVCSCTARVTPLATSGNEARNPATSSSAPASTPRSAGDPSPARRRARTAPVSSTGPARLIAHVSADHAVGNV